MQATDSGDTSVSAAKKLRAWTLPLLPPLVALLVEQLLWQRFHPNVWFLFYPAVFISSWLGGLRAAFVASLVSIGAVLFFLVPPANSFDVPSVHWIAAIVFFATGVGFGLVHDRLRKATQESRTALDASQRANADLKKVNDQRRIFEALVENSSDFIGIADPMGRPVYLNPGGRRMVGLGPDQPIEQTEIVDYYSEDQRAFASEVIVREMIEHGRGQGETAFRHWQTQAVIPVSDTHFMIRDPETGEILGMGTITRDISDVLSARDEVEAARRRLEQASAAMARLVEQAPDGVFVATLDGRYTEVNSAGCRMLGYAREELIGRRITDLLPPESAEALEHERKVLLAGGSRVSEWSLRRKDGTWLPVETSAAILPDGRWQAFVRDVSERKRTEEALRKADTEQQFFSEVGSVLATSLDLEATVTSIGRLATRSFANVCIVYVVDDDRRFHRLKAVTRDADKSVLDEVVRRTPLVRTPPPATWAELAANRSILIPRVSQDQLAAAAENEEHLRALRALDPQSVIVAPLFAHGRLLGAIALGSPAADRVYTQADLRFAEQLAQRAAHAVDNAQLYAKAWRAIQTRDNVLGIVAHDLRNPLGVIQMQAALMRRPGHEPDRRTKRPFDSIERSAQRMSRLIQDLLDVAQMDEGGLSVTPSRVSARQTVSESFDAQESLASAASLKLRLELAKDLPDVWADHDRLLQIFENLIGNAMKFTPTGGTITVGAAARDGDVLFRVADTGSGIAPEDLPHVFERFWQAEKGESRGAGLGLPIVKGLVEAHGGRISIESARGQGTTIAFTLPAASRVEPAAGAAGVAQMPRNRL